MDTTAEAGKLCQFDKVVTTGDYHGEVGDDDDDDDSDDGDDDDDVIDSAFLYMICSLDVERCSLRGQGRRQECLARACRIEERLAHQPLYSCRGCENTAEQSCTTLRVDVFPNFGQYCRTIRSGSRLEPCTMSLL